MPKTQIKRKVKNPQGIVIKYELSNGSSFDIMTHEQDTTQFEGWSGDMVWFDEPPPRDKYVACLRGLVDTKGRGILTLTPLSQPWIYDEIYVDHDKDVFCVTVDMRDNPYLSEEAIKEFESSLTEDEKEARVHGKFLHLSGLVYKEFEPTVHVIEPRNIEGAVYFSMDPHDRTPTKMIWAKVDDFGDVYIVREASMAMTVEDISKEIKRIEKKENLVPVRRFIDPNYGMKKLNIVTGRTIKEEFELNGIKLTLANDDLTAGHLKVKQYLNYDYKKPISLINRPKLYVLNTCKEVIYGFTHYLWEEWKHMDEQERDKKEKPKDLHKHFPDCVRYLLMANPSNHKPKIYNPHLDLYGTGASRG